MTARLFLLALAPLIAACATTRQQDDARAAEAVREAAAATRASLAATGAATVAVAPQPLLQHRSIDPTRLPSRAAALIGAPAETVRAALGDPNLVRAEGPTEVWLYRGASCFLDLVLYREGDSGEGRVAHAQARAAGLARIGETECLREIVSAPPPVPHIGPALITRTAGRAS
jgi:hypothetical protein